MGSRSLVGRRPRRRREKKTRRRSRSERTRRMTICRNDSSASGARWGASPPPAAQNAAHDSQRKVTAQSHSAIHQRRPPLHAHTADRPPARTTAHPRHAHRTPPPPARAPPHAASTREVCARARALARACAFCLADLDPEWLSPRRDLYDEFIKVASEEQLARFEQYKRSKFPRAGQVSFLGTSHLYKR